MFDAIIKIYLFFLVFEASRKPVSQRAQHEMKFLFRKKKSLRPIV